jgi:hypothetical protein
MYMALGSRPDIAFSVTALSRYNIQPLKMHLTDARRVLRYLKTTSELRIHYRRLSYPQISAVGFTDSDWAGNLTTRKSIGGCVFGLGYIDGNNELVTSGLIHWQAESQSMAADGMSVQVSEGPVPIECDNQVPSS